MITKVQLPETVYGNWGFDITNWSVTKWGKYYIILFIFILQYKVAMIIALKIVLMALFAFKKCDLENENIFYISVFSIFHLWRLLLI